MMSLFSSFDMFFYSSSWFIFFIFTCIFLISFYKFSFFTSLINLVKKNMIFFFYSLKEKSFNKMTSLLGFSAMISVFLLNFLSVFSYSFPLTSQFGLVLGVSLYLWASFVMFNIFSKFESFLSHLIPEGAPMGLSFILFLIELVSNLIRPITLTVRLVANILAGHLLMILLSKMVVKLNIFISFYLLLNGVEMVVGLIQSYIYCTMLMLYFSEVH